MKKTLLLLLSAGSFAVSVAQPTIHASDMHPVAGETIPTRHSYASASPINPGPNGPNQTWDFSSLSPSQSNPWTEVYVSPAGTFNQSSFPTANLAKSGGGVDYYITDNDHIAHLGWARLSAPYVDELHINPRSMFRYPLTYNTHYSEIIAETVLEATSSTPGIDPYADTSRYTGKIDWDVVGYGTVILPSGTFNNVLKMTRHTIDTQTKSYMLTHTSATYHNDYTETYWLYPGIHTPIVYSSGNLTIYTTASPLAVNEIVTKKYNVSCFPNPAQNTVNISFELKQPGDVTLQIIAANGSLIQKKEAHDSQSGLMTIPLAIDQLAPGIYFVDLNLSGVHINQQFLKN